MSYAPGDVTGDAVVVLAPEPILTVTVEAGPEGDDIHLHAGGQGVWIARMVVRLGGQAVLCGPFGGETGKVVAALVAEEGMAVRAVETSGSNGAYVHDRRGGERVEVAATPPEPLTRHELDELYGAALVGGLEAGVCVLGGPGPWDPPILFPDLYRRLAGDLSGNGARVVADLSGKALEAALEGGLWAVKVGHEQLMADGRVDGDDTAGLVAAMEDLRSRGAERVVLTRADEPALVLVDGSVLEVVPPALEAVDDRGAGDATTAGLAAGVARGLDFTAGVRLGVAAGGLNVTRRGLATGDRREIERLAERIELRPLEGSGPEGRVMSEK